jgi:tRNA A37 threonylcarbamoyladenosine biosynthesis protein TsaE
MYHFDLYRLENEGIKTIIDELREYSKNCVTFVEWAEFSQDEFPFNHLKVNVTYGEDDERIYEFIPFGENSERIIEGLR